MARSPISVSGVSITGTAPPSATTADPSAGHNIANPDGQTVLIVTNTGATSHALGVQFATEVDGQQVIPRTYNIPAGTTHYLTAFHPLWYGANLLLNPNSAELTIAAIRAGESITTAALPPTPFWLVGLTVAADDTQPGINTSGNVLIVDTDLAPATADGNALIVSV